MDESFFEISLYSGERGEAAKKILKILIEAHLSYCDAQRALEIAQSALQEITYPSFE